MLVIRNLTKIYKPQKSQEIVALNKLNINFGDKGLVFVLGKSGCGKSTLLNMIGGIEEISDGKIIVDGYNISERRNKMKYFRTKVGFLFQNFAL